MNARCALGFTILAWAGSPLASTIWVTSHLDAPDASAIDGICSALTPQGPQCTLRAALMHAVSNDVIELPPGEYVVELPRNAALPDAYSGDLDIHGKLVTVRGVVSKPRPLIRTSIALNDSTFGVQSTSGHTGELTLQHLEIAGNPSFDGNGGAINCQSGRLSLSSVIVRDSVSDYSGGAIHTNCVTAIERSQFYGNIAAGGGGAIYTDGPLMIDASSFWDNAAESSGGAIRRPSGGASSSFTRIRNSTFVRNSSPDASAIDAGHASINLVNVTVTGNGGAPDGKRPPAVVAARLITSNSIVAGNSDDADFRIVSSFESLGHNVLGNIDYDPATAVASFSAFDLIGAGQAELLPLQVVPGSTTGVPTMPPSVGSPARSHGDPLAPNLFEPAAPDSIGNNDEANAQLARCRAVDANGTIRGPGNCDAGAAQFSAGASLSSVTLVVNDAPDPSLAAQDFQVVVEVHGDEGTPTGSVLVEYGSQACTLQLPLQQCAFVSEVSGLSDIEVTYSGDASFAATTLGEPHTVVAGGPIFRDGFE